MIRDETCGAVALVAGVFALYSTVAAIVSWNTMSAGTTELLCQVTVCTDNDAHRR